MILCKFNGKTGLATKTGYVATENIIIIIWIFGAVRVNWLEIIMIVNGNSKNDIENTLIKDCENKMDWLKSNKKR